MSWLRLDDGYARHRKIAPLSDRAFRLNVTLKLECASQLTDGRMALAVIPTLPNAPRGKALQATIRELVDAGLWELDGADVVVHDFLDYNPSRAKTLEDRDAVTERVRAHRAKRNAVTSAPPPQPVTPLQGSYQPVTNAEVTPPPSPSPSPDQIQPDNDDPRPDRLGAPARAPVSSSSPASAQDSDRELPCPLDLASTFQGYPELARACGCSEVELRETAAEFVGYWTCGGGAGKRRAHWAAKLREDLRRKHHPTGDLRKARRASSGDPESESRVRAAASSEFHVNLD